MVLSQLPQLCLLCAQKPLLAPGLGHFLLRGAQGSPCHSPIPHPANLASSCSVPFSRRKLRPSSEEEIFGNPGLAVENATRSLEDPYVIPQPGSGQGHPRCPPAQTGVCGCPLRSRPRWPINQGPNLSPSAGLSWGVMDERLAGRLPRNHRAG